MVRRMQAWEASSEFSGHFPTPILYTVDSHSDHLWQESSISSFKEVVYVLITVLVVYINCQQLWTCTMALSWIVETHSYANCS